MACGPAPTAQSITTAPSAIPAAIPNSTPAKPQQAQPLQTTWANKYAFETKSLNWKADYELSAEYPEFSVRFAKLRRFNEWIKKRVLGHAARFRRLAEAERHGGKRKIPPIEQGLALTFTMYYSDSNLISLRLTHRVMEAGQMHPINYYETINYDLQRGRPLRVDEVFKWGYLKELSTFSRNYLTETYELAADDWVRAGTAPRRANFSNWNLVPDGVLLSFEDYQVNAHSFGQPEFVVPFSSLQGVIRRNSIADRLMAGRNPIN